MHFVHGYLICKLADNSCHMSGQSVCAASNNAIESKQYFFMDCPENKCLIKGTGICVDCAHTVICYFVIMITKTCLNAGISVMLTKDENWTVQLCNTYAWIALMSCNLYSMVIWWQKSEWGSKPKHFCILCKVCSYLSLSILFYWCIPLADTVLISPHELRAIFTPSHMTFECAIVFFAQLHAYSVSPVI